MAKRDQGPPWAWAFEGVGGCCDLHVRQRQYSRFQLLQAEGLSLSIFSTRHLFWSQYCRTKNFQHLKHIVYWGVVVGIPLLLKSCLVSWFLGFLVSRFLVLFSVSLFLVVWFLGFLVSKFLGFKVPWFQSFLVSWAQSFKVSMIPYYQKSISCVLEDIDSIFKISKK